MPKGSGAGKQQRNRTQLISPNNFQTHGDMSFVINPNGPATHNKGLGTYAPEMGGFITTTAKDVGKRIFNFTQQ